MNPYEYEYANADNTEDQFASEYDFGNVDTTMADEDIDNPEKQPIIDEDNILNQTNELKQNDEIVDQ